MLSSLLTCHRVALLPKVQDTPLVKGQCVLKGKKAKHRQWANQFNKQV